jgi:hypothetical protein
MLVSFDRPHAHALFGHDQCQKQKFKILKALEFRFSEIVYIKNGKLVELIFFKHVLQSCSNVIKVAI